MGQRALTTKIDAKWGEPLEQEQTVLGCDSRAECVEHILGSYFGQKTSAVSDEQKGEARANMGEGTAAVGSKGTPSADSSQEATSLAKEVGNLTASLTGAQREAQRWQGEAESLGAELERWQAMDKHAPVPQILDHLASCPNCQPQLQSFLDHYVNTLPPGKVKEIARQQKWWPPPPLELPTRKGRA